MFRNYLSVTLRNLFRQKGYSFINIFGLAIGVATTIVILLVVQFETSFENMHTNGKNIYRINSYTTLGGTANEIGVSPAALAAALKEALPDIVAITRVRNRAETGIEIDNRFIFSQEGLAIVDPDYLKMFNFPLLSGDPETVLEAPNSLLITESFARRVYGELPEIGTAVHMSDNQDYTLTGILADPPKNTMFQFDGLFSMSTMPASYHETWGSMNLTTFVLLDENTDPELVATKALDLLNEQIGPALEQLNIEWTMSLFRFTDIHLNSDVLGDPDTNTPKIYVIGISAIALFILLLACINFINLSTARSTRRAREVGVRKVMGAHRGGLIRQFLGESTVYALISVLIAILIVAIVLPSFRTMMDIPVSFNMLLSPLMLLGLIGIVLTVGLVSGSFPAFFLSSFQPIQVLKQGTIGTAKGNTIRRILVIGQFVVSIALILATITTYWQIDLIRKLDLGFDKANVFTLRPNNAMEATQLKTFKESLASLPGVECASIADGGPFGGHANKTVFEPSGAAEGEKLESWVFIADADFLRTYGIEILKGRDFDPELSSDVDGAVIINETAMNSVSWLTDVLDGEIPVEESDTDPEAGEEPSETKLKIIGVTKDFHFFSLHDPIEPMILVINEEGATQVAVRLAPGDQLKTREMIIDQWKEMFPDINVTYRFVDEAVEEAFQSDREFGKLITTFALLAMIIAALGLFGLVSHTAEARTKELGVRKVLGASETGLVVLLTKEFTQLVLVAAVIAIPLSMWVMNKWLQDFAERIQIGPGIIAISIIASLMLAWLSVSWQAIRAARRNPVESLRYE